MTNRSMGMTMPFSVLAVDDEMVVLEVLATLMEDDERLVLTGVAPDGEQALRLARTETPDAIVCDLQMPRMSGLEALPLLREACPQSVIVVYTSDTDKAATATECGADAVVAKSEGPAVLLDRVAELCQNGRGHH